jgi:endonuclease-3
VPRLKKTSKNKATSAKRAPAGKGGRESAVRRSERARRIAAGLRALYPEADCALEHDSALKLLVATILSAQCTDARVNQITPGLFRRYPDAAAFAAADQSDLEEAIRSTGFFRNKAKSIRGMAQLVCEVYDGEVPDTMDDLLRLPGVARKTANCVLGTWFRKNVGVVVDTHVGRLAERLRLTWRSKDSKDAVKIEQDLMELFDSEDWTWLSHALIQHGRRVCTARKPKCAECTLAAGLSLRGPRGVSRPPTFDTPVPPSPARSLLGDAGRTCCRSHSDPVQNGSHSAPCAGGATASPCPRDSCASRAAGLAFQQPLSAKPGNRIAWHVRYGRTQVPATPATFVFKSIFRTDDASKESPRCERRSARLWLHRQNIRCGTTRLRRAVATCGMALCPRPSG